MMSIVSANVAKPSSRAARSSGVTGLLRRQAPRNDEVQAQPSKAPMKLTHFFIERPIFAGVLSFVVFVLGLLAVFRLPIAEYPEVVPPTVVVTASYPGATAQVLSATIATPLEQEIVGVEDMTYLNSQAHQLGSAEVRERGVK